MLTFLKSRWHVISTLLLLILLAALFFMPNMANAFSIAGLLVSLGLAIAFIVRRQVQSHHSGEIKRTGMLRNIFFEVIGLLLTMALAALVVRSMIEMINLSSVSWIGIGIGTAIALSVLIGLVVGWLVKATWGLVITHK